MSLILQSLNFPILIISFLSLIFVALNVCKKYCRAGNNSVLKLPPGPRKLPIIGNLHQLVFSRLPHRLLTNLAKKYGPVMHFQLGEISTVVISSPEAIREMLTTHGTSFSDKPKMLAADIMSYNYLAVAFTPYGDYWRQMKKICVTEILSAKSVRGFRSVREEEVWNLIGDISQSRGLPINLSKKVFSLTVDVSSRVVFGKKIKGHDVLFSLAKVARRFTGGFDIADLFPSLGTFLGYATGLIPALKAIHGIIDRAIEDVVRDHKARSRDEDDIIDFLLKATESGQLDFEITNNHIKAVAMDLFTGGSESSSSTIEWAMTELVRHPRSMNKVQSELREVLKGKTRIEEKDIEKLDYLRAVVKETLRTHPPGALILRESRERCVIAGYDIPAKTKVIMNAWALARDPDYWIDAESFEPERFLDGRCNADFRGTNFAYIPFGGGRRMCPGISFATATIELALSQMLYHFDWEMPNGGKPEELDAAEEFGLTCRRKNDLYLVPIIQIPFHY